MINTATLLIVRRSSFKLAKRHVPLVPAKNVELTVKESKSIKAEHKCS
jgi:hypothetical protein